jgi:hypothetical protein
MRIAAAFDDIEDVIVSCQVNTAAFAAATGVANFFNGPHTLSVRAIIPGGNDIATPSTPLIFNNISGVIGTLTNSNGTDPASAINPGTGLQWIGGGVTVNFVGVSYVQGTTVSTVSCQIFGKSPVVTLTNGAGSVAWTETSSNWSATNSSLTNYLSGQAETLICSSAVLSNGQPMPTTAGSVLLNYGSPANPLVGGNAAMPALQVVRLDNLAPGATAANIAAPAPYTAPAQASVSALVQAMVAPWVNATTTLTPSATGSGVNTLGLPSLATLNTAAAGPGNDVDEGVDAITVAVWVPAAGQALPTTGGSCNVTGLTSVTTGNQLAETTVSSAFPARIVFRDALGNQFCMDLAQAFGADFTAPTATITGPVANTGYNVTPPVWTVAPTDNASGFTTNLLRVTMNRVNESGTTSCIINTGGTCTGGSTAAQPNNLSATGGTGIEGYYTTSITLTDAAGNTAVLVTNQVNSFDQSIPTFTGGISLPAVIAGGVTNTFTTTVADSLDLGSIFGVVSYPGVGINIQYPTQQIGTFGTPLEQSSANLGYAVANWIRCLNIAPNFATAANPPQDISLVLTDLTTIASTNTDTLTSGAFGANAQTCTGTVGNLGGVAVPISFGPVTANYGTGNTQVDLDGVTVATGSSTTVTLTVVADVPLNSSVDPFSRVDFYYDSDPGAGVTLTRIGAGSAVLAQTPTQRTYTYTFTWDPAAPVPAGSILVTAIGVDAQGDAVAATGVFVTIVP